MISFQACGELQEPSLCRSQEAEEKEYHTAKTTLQLMKVLAGIMPANFASSEVFESLIVLLRHDDKEIGEACTNMYPNLFFLLRNPLNFPYF